ncbi:ArsR/SmtB family transcription factor [Pseudonocardia sp. TMWB2A]|uniref:ArsR/SmtB family transcription factor n=1 Tax=Pseudonocardia sp. TMWB2A TaxID=687430 RepID=UPI00307DC119
MPADPPPPGPADPLPEELLHETAAAFGMLSATVRLHIMWLLASGERDVGTLAEELGHSVATVSHHLGKLKLAGWVRARREGRRQIYLVDDDEVVDIVRRAVHHQHELRHTARARRRRRGA